MTAWEQVHTAWEKARRERDHAASRLAFIVLHGDPDDAPRAAEDWTDHNNEMTRLDTKDAS